MNGNHELQLASKIYELIDSCTHRQKPLSGSSVPDSLENQIFMLCKLAGEIQPEPSFIDELEQRLLAEAYAVSTVSDKDEKEAICGGEDAGSVDISLRESQPESGKNPNYTFLDLVRSFVPRMQRNWKPTLRWAVIIGLLIITAFVLPMISKLGIGEVSAEEALQKANERFHLQLGDDEVAYTRFVISVKGNIYDPRIQGYHDRNYLAETWVSGDGESFRYQLVGPSKGTLYFFLQKEGDVIRRSSMSGGFGFNEVKELVEIPFDAFIQQVEYRSQGHKIPIYLATGDVINSLFNLNQFLTPDHRVCLELACLIEIDEQSEKIHFDLIEPQDETVSEDALIVELSVNPDRTIYPFARLDLQPDTYELRSIEAGYITNLRGNKEHDVYSKAILEERTVLPLEAVPAGLFSEIPDGVKIIRPLVLDGNDGVYADELWVISTSLEPGNVLGHEENILFEVEFGYSLRTVSEANAIVELRRLDVDERIAEIIRVCPYGVPGSWVSAGRDSNNKIAAGEGTFQAMFMVGQKDLFELGPTTVILSVQLSEETGNKVYLPIWSKEFPEYVYYVDVPEVVNRECPVPPGLE